MKRSLEIPVADGRADGRHRIYRTPVGSAGGPKNDYSLKPTEKAFEILLTF